jgi:hypothetical protein
MQSIFDLKTSADQLESSNYGVSRDLYEQQAPTRDVTNANFPNGSINFRWQTGATKWWVPSRTYLRFRIALRGRVTTIDANTDDMAPIMNQCAALFQSAEFRLNDKTISRVSDYMPQIDTLQTRLNKSRSWIESVGASSNWWQESFQVRQENICFNGTVSTGVDAEQSRAELGFELGATLATTVATGIVTFAATAVDVTTKFAAGDKLIITNGNARYELIVVDRPSATTLLVSGLITGNDLAAAAYTFVRSSTRGKENASRRTAIYEVTWTPPLSIFQVDHAIPSSRCELILNPQTASVYKKAVVESNTLDKIVGTGVNPNEFDVNIENMYLYVNTVEGSRVDNLTYYLDLEQYSCQAESGLSREFAQKNFDVSPSTKALCVAFQDGRVGTNTLFSATKFRCYDTLPTGKDETQQLNRMFVNYAGVSKPQIDADPKYISSPLISGTDFTTQRYIESILNSGAYHDTGGAETIQEWQNRGSYYLFNWSKDGNDRSTRVSVHTGFDNTTVLTNARLLLFSISSQIAKVVISNGSVTDVQLEDA